VSSPDICFAPRVLTGRSTLGNSLHEQTGVCLWLEAYGLLPKEAIKDEQFGRQPKLPRCICFRSVFARAAGMLSSPIASCLLPKNDKCTRRLQNLTAQGPWSTMPPGLRVSRVHFTWLLPVVAPVSVRRFLHDEGDPTQVQGCDGDWFLMSDDVDLSVNPLSANSKADYVVTEIFQWFEGSSARFAEARITSIRHGTLTLGSQEVS